MILKINPIMNYDINSKYIVLFFLLLICDIKIVFEVATVKFYTFLRNDRTTKVNSKGHFQGKV